MGWIGFRAELKLLDSQNLKPKLNQTKSRKYEFSSEPWVKILKRNPIILPVMAHSYIYKK